MKGLATRRELLLGTALVGVSLNIGQVEPASGQIAPAATLTVCGSGGAQYTTIHSALRAAAGDYSRPYDVRITCGGTYDEVPGRIDFNGTLEATAPGVMVQDTLAAGAQYYFAVGTMTTPWPGSQLTMKGFHIDGLVRCPDGTVACKTRRCVQIQSTGRVTFDSMDFTNCQDGVLGADWTPGLGYKSGLTIFSGNRFNNNCSPNGPSHSIYINAGTVVVGGTIDVGGTPVVAQPNVFGECNVGYNVKSRALRTIVDNNTFVQNFTVASSAAIDDSNGGLLEVVGNTMTYGPQTGKRQPAYGILLGGLLGQNIPASYKIDRNTMTLSGVAVPFTPVSSLDNNSNVLVTNNRLPPRSALRGGLIIDGQGSIGAGNTYANGARVTPVVQNIAWDSTTLLADYRGTATPHDIAVGQPEKTVRGGNGLLTVSVNASTDAVIGGPGGINLHQERDGNNVWVWTDRASISNNVTLTKGFQTFDYGANDVLTVPGFPCRKSAINVLAGHTTLRFESPTEATTCQAFIYNGATLTVHEANAYNAFQVYPGGSLSIDGTVRREAVSETDGRVSVSVNVQTDTAGRTPFVFSVNDGAVEGDTWVTAHSGTIAAIRGWRMTTFEDDPAHIPTITLSGPISQTYFIDAASGGVIFAGDNKVEVGGSGRARGPAPRPITYHIQGSAAGSTINAEFSPVSVYLDGPGHAKVGQANKSAQPARLEVDADGSGSVEITSPWRNGTDVAVLRGVAIASQGRVGSNYVVGFTNGGTVQFDHTGTVTFRR